MSQLNGANWLNILKQLSLAKTEIDVTRRFASDPEGRGFLPVADILRSHGLEEESLELLTQGIEAHPTFSVARVVLARELYHRSMFREAWRTLAESPKNLFDNVLAQKLIFKMALAFGDEAATVEALKNLRVHQGMDPDIRRLADMLETAGIVAARDHWRRELAASGIKLQFVTDADISASELKEQNQGGKGSDSRASLALTDNVRKELSGFHVVPLREVFKPGVYVGPGHQAGGAKVELDSTTLAEIYTKQGHYGRALDIYRRLLRLAPHNDLIRMKVSELARLDQGQRQADLQNDPVLYDRMEVMAIIDRQMQFYDDLLQKLET